MVIKKGRQRSIRLPDDLDEAVQQLADTDGRSFSSMVERALRFYVEHASDAPAQKAQPRAKAKR